MSRWAGAVGIVAVAIVTLLSCRQIVGITDSPPMDIAPTSTACGLPWGTSTCASCVHANCCAVSSSCAQDTACAPYLQCLGACKIGDWSCRSKCALDNPSGGAPEVPMLEVCTATNCESECGLTCGALPLVASPDAAAACLGCFEMDSTRCASALACARSADCTGWLQCQMPGSTPDERRACDDAFGLADAGVPGTAAYEGVLPPELSASVDNLGGAGPCLLPCALSTSWECVGRTTWPNPTLGGTTLETLVVEAATGQSVSGTTVPVPGVQAQVCRFGDANCTMALNSPPAFSDMNGFVTLTVPPAALTVNTVDANSYVQFTSPSTFPALYFLGYPVSARKAQIAHPYVFLISTSNAPAGWDTSLGLLNAAAFDCTGAAAPGVQFTIDLPDASGVIPYYFDDNNNPDTSLKATTNGGGLSGGGFLNVPPGTVTITATPIAIGKASAKATVLVRAGTQTDVFLFPGVPPT